MYRVGERGGGGNQESDFRSTKVFGVRVRVLDEVRELTVRSLDSGEEIA
jgi:hypothetical protein